jgi:acetylornithine deacetylase/succinyl-diaminopimelate desuccinylase-like protein
MNLNSARQFARNRRARIVSQLQDFVRIPSVSDQPTHARDVQRCAAWLAKHLQSIRMHNVKVLPTARHPLVYADWKHSPRKPTVLIYGHYDVQPADPVEQWRSPPFAAMIRGDNLYGRGACDDKGQLFAHLCALEAYLRTANALPVNVKCLFEGEEEIGSPNLKPFLSRHRKALAADVVIMSDTRMLAPDRPAITISLRGSLGLEVELRGAESDLHSGNFGGAIHNPLQALSEMHDRHGRIAIPGFYEQVRNWPAAERERMARTGPSDAAILRDAKAQLPWGEAGYSLYERTTIRPALTINGLTGGYQGPGGKAVIPSTATAKISFRLVPNQEPQEIERLVREHLGRITPPTMKLVVRTLAHARPAVVEPQHPAVQAAARAYQSAFDSAPVMVRSGGSIPVVNMFQQLLQVPTVLMGFALPDSRIHAPNERFHLPTFLRGVDTCIHFLSEIETSLVGSGTRLPLRTERVRL